MLPSFFPLKKEIKKNSSIFQKIIKESLQEIFCLSLQSGLSRKHLISKVFLCALSYKISKVFISIYKKKSPVSQNTFGSTDVEVISLIFAAGILSFLIIAYIEPSLEYKKNEKKLIRNIHKTKKALQKAEETLHICQAAFNSPPPRSNEPYLKEEQIEPKKNTKRWIIKIKKIFRQIYQRLLNRR